MAGLRWWFLPFWNRMIFLAISRDDIVERKFRITNNNAIDMHVGKRMRLRRTLLGMS